jgi:hypothetical protein
MASTPRGKVLGRQELDRIIAALRTMPRADVAARYGRPIGTIARLARVHKIRDVA